MLDEFRVKKPAGFPDHPHRGIQTVTLMLKGSFIHEDFTGRTGTLNAGDMQWMNAGRVSFFFFSFCSSLQFIFCFSFFPLTLFSEFFLVLGNCTL